MVTVPALVSIDWPDSRRIVGTIYPPIHLFEEGSPPEDWELLASLEAKTNPRVLDQIGNLRLVPPDRRVSGPTASLAMAPFCHASKDRPGRFSDGSFGVWYGADVVEVALMETAYHFIRFMARTHEPAVDRDYRELVTHVRGALHDLSSDADCLDPDDWTAAQSMGRNLRAANSHGVAYPSVRYPKGNACALFYPDLIRLPVNQGRSFRYHWDGAQMNGYFVYGEGNWRSLPT